MEYRRLRDIQSSVNIQKNTNPRDAISNYHRAYYGNTKILVDYTYDLPVDISFSKVKLVLIGDKGVGKSTISSLSVTGLSSQFTECGETYTYSFTTNKSEMMNCVFLSEKFQVNSSSIHLQGYRFKFKFK
jgi:predicted ATPase